MYPKDWACPGAEGNTEHEDGNEKGLWWPGAGNSCAAEFHLAGVVTKNQIVPRNVKGGKKSAIGNEKAVNKLWET